MSRNPARKPQRSINERRLYWEIGFRIRVAREASGRNQTVLAKQIGLSRTSLVNIEGGKQRLTLHCLYQIAVALGTKPANLLPTKAEIQR